MKTIFTSFFIFFFWFSDAQIIIKGNISSSKKEPLENVNVTIEDISDDSVLGFSITNQNGDYKIVVDNSSSKMRIVVSTFNYEKIIQSISSNSQTLNFSLNEHSNVLQEVKINVNPIQQKGDTITYNVKSFEGKEDRTLSDVLKKIPGIEVEKNGLIKYQGAPINKFYIEGKDLMSGGYGTLTNSLPKDAASKIQVLENHQPIKALKNSVASNRASINIKLKKDVTLTGRADVGAGLNPFLWSAKITPMVFTKKYQYLFNYKSNNTGENITSELLTFSFDEGFEGLTFDNLTGYWLNTSQPIQPRIDENRFLDNNTHLFSANFLTDLSKNWEFKANSSFTKDNINRIGEDFSKINLYDSNGNLFNSIEYKRVNKSEIESNQLKSQIVLTKNADKTFLKNTTTYKGNWNKTFDNVLINANSLNENVISPGYSFQNSLSAIFLVDKKVINLKSTLNFVNDNQEYVVSPYQNIEIASFPILTIDKVKQNLFENTLSFDNEGSFIFTYKKVSIIPTLGVEIDSRKLKSNIIGFGSSAINFGDNFVNDVKYNKFIPKTNFGLNYLDESFTIGINFPIKFNHIKVNDDRVIFKKEISKITFEPNFNIKYKFNAEFSQTLYASVSNDFSTLDNIYPSYIFSALNVANQNSDISQSKNKKIGGSFEYKMILKSLFFNLNYELNQNAFNNIVSQDVSQNGQTTFQQVPFENKSMNRFINLEASKFLNKFKSKLTVGLGWKDSSSSLIVNNNKVDIESNANTLNFKINSNTFSWLTFDYNFSYLINERGNNKTNTIKSYLKTIFYVTKNQSVSIYKDDNFYKYYDQNYKNQFLDLSYQYTLEKSKIDFELRWSNILNSKKYEEVILSNLGYTSDTFYIRPSQVLASVRFNFN